VKLRKVTDFIRLEEGNIGRKSAVVTGALLASSVLGTVLVSIADTRNAEAYYEEPHCDAHSDRILHQNHSNHSNSHFDTPGEPC